MGTEDERRGFMRRSMIGTNKRQSSDKDPHQDYVKKQGGRLKNRLRAKWKGDMHVSYAKEWACLMDEEKQVISQFFNTTDAMAGTTYLNLEEMLACLRTLGVQGKDEKEQTDIRDACIEHKTCDVESFVCMVLPQIRRRLGEVMRPRLEEEFNKAADKEMHAAAMNMFTGSNMLKMSLGPGDDKTKTVGIDGVQKLLESLLVSQLQSTESKNTLIEAFHYIMGMIEEARSQHLHISKSSSGGVSSNSFSRMNSSALLECFSQDELRLNFAAMEIVFQKCHEMHARMMTKRMENIRAQAKAAMDPEDWPMMRRHVEPLYWLFSQFDEDSSGALDKEEVRGLLQEYGFLSGCPGEDAVVLTIVEEDLDADGESLWDFPTFICKYHYMREELKKHRHESTWAIFRRNDQDGDGELSMLEVSNMLAALGLTPKTHEEQHEIKELVDLADDDGSGLITYEEFQHLAQLVMERIRNMQRRVEMTEGLALDFTREKVREFRDAFWLLDETGSGFLDITGLRKSMRMLRQRIDGDALRALFTAIDHDNSGHIDFIEFLRLMRAIENENCRTDARQSTLATVLSTKVAKGLEVAGLKPLNWDDDIDLQNS